MKLRTQMQPHTILLRPSETLHDGTKNGRTTKSHKINISPCSKKQKQNVPLTEEEEEVQQLEVGEFRKKSHNCEVVRDKLLLLQILNSQ